MLQSSIIFLTCPFSFHAFLPPMYPGQGCWINLAERYFVPDILLPFTIPQILQTPCIQAFRNLVSLNPTENMQLYKQLKRLTNFHTLCFCFLLLLE